MTPWTYSPILRIVPCSVVACSFNLTAQARYSGGNGTAGAPYLTALSETRGNYDKHLKVSKPVDPEKDQR